MPMILPYIVLYDKLGIPYIRDCIGRIFYERRAYLYDKFYDSKIWTGSYSRCYYGLNASKFFSCSYADWAVLIRCR